MSIDVVVRTKDCRRTISDCITAIQQHIPFNKIIVVDGGSKDGTLEYLRDTVLGKEGRLIVYDEPRLSLLEAVLFGIKHASSDVVACIDSDIVVSNNWFVAMSGFLGDDVGVVEGGTVEHYAIPNPFSGEKRRGNLNNILAKRDVLMGVEQRTVHVREDAFLQYWIEKKIGMRWVKSGLLCSDHYSDAVRYRNTGSYLSVRRYRMPRGVIEQSAQADLQMKNRKRIVFLLLDAFNKPMRLFVDMMREWYYYMVAYIRGLL